MAWVAFDRAIPAIEGRLADETDPDRRQHLTESVEQWKQERAAVRKQVCENGFDEQFNSFVQAYGSKTLDASCLRIALVGFLPATDPRIVGTVEATRKHLMKDGFVQRYDTSQTEDGLRGGEGSSSRAASGSLPVSGSWSVMTMQESSSSASSDSPTMLDCCQKSTIQPGSAKSATSHRRSRILHSFMLPSLYRAIGFRNYHMMRADRIRRNAANAA
jgi:hypothetical protein